MKSKIPLSKQEEDFYRWILGYLSDNDISPTRNEIALNFNISKTRASQVIHNIESKGWIKIIKGRYRNIKIPK